MDQTKTQTGRHDWVVFLCTDTALSVTEILQRYAIRWAVDVYYFKEAKQPLGLLKEPNNHYAAYITSIQFGSHPTLPAGHRQTNTRSQQQYCPDTAEDWQQ